MKNTPLKSTMLIVLALAAGTSTARADNVTEALRPVSDFVSKGNSILVQACDTYRNANGNPIVSGLTNALLGSSAQEQIKAIGDSACRLSETTSDINRILSQDSWIGMGRSALTRLAQGASLTDDQTTIAGLVDQLMAGFESGSVDTMAMMQSVSQAYLQRTMTQGDVVKTNVQVMNGVSIDPDQPGVVEGGQLVTDSSAAMLKDPDASAALFGIKSSLSGLGSVYANQAGTTQAMESTGENLAQAAENSKIVNGDLVSGDPGLAATRVHEAETAGSMRETLNVLVKSNSDMLRMATQGDVATLEQLSENAKLQSATNSLLATDVEMKLREKKDAAEAEIASFKARQRRSYDGYRTAMANATGMQEYVGYLSGGADIKSFSWEDISGLNPNSNAMEK